MDPNWFYSTLAQSTAAVVGLAGGFLFSWLLSRRGELITERRAYVNRLNGIIDRLEDLKRRADSRYARTEDVLQKIGDQRAAGVSDDRLQIPEFELLSHSAYKVPHPSSEDLTALKQLPSVYKRLREAIATDRRELARALLAAKPLDARGAPEYRKVELRDDPFQKTGIGPENFWLGVREQTNYAIWSWQQISREYDQLAFSLKVFREGLVPPSIYFLILILFGLVAAGVVAPMAFLSAQSGLSKCVLFAISAPLIFAFVGYMGYQVWELRHAADLSRDTI